MQPVDQRRVPVQRLHLLLHLCIQRTVTIAVIRQAAGRVQVDGLKRAHEAPAQAEAVFHQRIEIGRRNDIVGEQAKRLGQQRALQAVQCETVDLLPDGRWHLPGFDHDRAGAFGDRRIGPGRGADLDQRDKVRRVHRVRDQAALPGRQMGGERAGRNAG